MPSQTTILEVRNISKTFGSVTALSQVDFSLREGEVHGLLGENGAGKSTLMNILYGLYHADVGELILHGEALKISSPLDSIHHGIGMIHQSSTLVPEFTAFENIILGTTRKKRSLRSSDEETRVQELFRRLHMEVPLHVRVKNLSAGEKQKVEIVRALYRGARILILDEPTTSLVENEFEQLLETLKLLTQDGVAIIFITHKIREVLQSCQRASVLKSGVMQGTIDIRNTNQQELVALMFGTNTPDITDSALPIIKGPQVELSEEAICTVRHLSVKAREKQGIDLNDISFEVYGGEILGIAGISGNGQKELAESLIHPTRIESGEVFIERTCINGYSPVQVFDNGVSYTAEDRKNDSILPLATISENTILGHHRESQFLTHKMLRWKEIQQKTRALIHEFAVKTPNEDTAIAKLSGGNIQRVVIARALLNPIKLLITHNPTSGLDMASVKFVFEKLMELKQEGSGVLYINEDLDELILICDRIGVIHEGHLVGFFEKEAFDKHTIGALMIGG